MRVRARPFSSVPVPPLWTAEQQQQCDCYCWKCCYGGRRFGLACPPAVCWACWWWGSHCCSGLNGRLRGWQTASPGTGCSAAVLEHRVRDRGDWAVRARLWPPPAGPACPASCPAERKRPGCRPARCPCHAPGLGYLSTHNNTHHSQGADSLSPSFTCSEERYKSNERGNSHWDRREI